MSTIVKTIDNSSNSLQESAYYFLFTKQKTRKHHLVQAQQFLICQLLQRQC
jgi:hypothetical protein